MRSGSALPQCGQTGPLDHNRPSRCSRAALSSWKTGLVRSTLDLLMAHSLAGRENVASQVWYVNRIVPGRFPGLAALVAEVLVLQRLLDLQALYEKWEDSRVGKEC